MVAPGDFVGPYRLLRLIGSGGMAQVFAATHERMDQEVALKLLLPSAAEDPQIVARFLQEARALAQLECPGVVRVFQCDRLDDGRVYLAMERLVGIRLRDWLEQQSGPAPLPAALLIARQIAEAMVEVHRKGIVHRDLKPENVFLCNDDSNRLGYRIKILDFGIAKMPPRQDESSVDTQVVTNAPIFLGTATYVAPEQCRTPATVNGQADVYALGVILFELCAGRPPFIAADRIDVITMHVRETPPPLSEFAPHVPGKLAAFLGSMLAKEPNERPTMERCRDMLALPWESEHDACPMPGLSAFTAEQAELFFGRNDEIAAIKALLEEARVGERRWIQIEGPSGVGKSSLVQASLLPWCKQSSHDQTPHFLTACMRPSAEPLRSLAAALARTLGHAEDAEEVEDAEIERIEAALRESPAALSTLIQTQIPSGKLLLLVVEQLEELFTIGDAERARLDELVGVALAAKGTRIRLLTTLRSDFLHRIEQAPHLAQQLNGAARYHLRALHDGALMQAIRGMAQRAGLVLADGLVERMVRDASSAASSLPLLAHALRGLWLLRRGPLLSHDLYDALGGVAGALSQQAERLLTSLGDEGRKRAEQMVLELVQVGRGVPDTRRPRPRQECLRAGGGDALAEEVLLALSGGPSLTHTTETTGMRLVVLSSASTPDLQQVDLIHETLLREVPSIASWIERDRALLERQADLEALARTWEQSGSPRSGLPSGTLLAFYGAQGRSTRKPSERAARFLASAKQLERRGRWARGVVASILCAAAVGIAWSAVVARREQRRAEAHLLEIVAATDDIVQGIDWDLGRILHTAEARRQMLSKTEERVLSLPDQRRDEVGWAVVHAKHRRSDFARAHATLAEADVLLVDAAARIQRGLATSALRAEWAFLEALNASKRGKVAMARGQWSEARVLFDRSVELLESTPKPWDADARLTIATSIAEKAELALAQRRGDLAAPLYGRAIELLSHEDAGDYERGELALALTGQAEAYRIAGDKRSARPALERALALQEPIAQKKVGNAYAQWILGRAHVELSLLLASEGEEKAASEHSGVALAIGRALHEGAPTDKHYALLFVTCLEGAESLARAGGDLQVAERLRVERCGLVSDAFARDPEDVRFQQRVCR